MKMNILNDEKYIYCISLAALSKNDSRGSDQRYGSILIKDNKIIGSGYNRAVSHSNFRLNRIIRQGWTNHAEIEAINDAFERGININNSDLYVAGYFVNSGLLFLHEQYTCTRCLPYLLRYNINNIYIPSIDGWIKKSLEEAVNDASLFKDNKYKKRKASVIGKFKIQLFKEKLLTQDQLKK